MATNKNKSIAVKLSLSTAGLQKGIKSAKFQLKRFASEVKDISKTVAFAAGTIAAAVGSHVVNEFKEFELSMTKVKAVTNATAAEFKSLRDEALRLGSVTQLTAVEISGLQLQLSKLGFKPEEINNMTESIAGLSIAMGESLVESGMAVGAVLKTFKMEAGQSASVVDTLTKSFSSSALDLSKFTDGLKYVGSVAEISGVSLEQLTAQFAILADRQIASSTMGTAMRTIFIKSAAAGMDYRDALELVANSKDKVTTAFKLFGKVAVPTAIILAENTEAIMDMEWALYKAGGTTKRMREMMEDTAHGAFMRMSSAVSALSIKVGKLVYDFISPLINKLTALANTIDTKLVASIVIWTAKIAGGAGLIWAFTSLISTMINVGTTIGRIVLSIGKIVAAMGLWAGVIVIVGLLLYELTRYMTSEDWKGVEDTFISLSNSISSFGGNLTDGIMFKFMGMVANIRKGFNDMIMVIEKMILKLNYIGKRISDWWNDASSKDKLKLEEEWSTEWDKIVSDHKRNTLIINDDYATMVNKLAAENKKNNETPLFSESFFSKTYKKVVDFSDKIKGLWSGLSAGITGIDSRDSQKVLPDIAKRITKIVNNRRIQGSNEYQPDKNSSIYSEIPNITPIGVHMAEISKGSREAANEFVQNWGSAVGAVSDIFGSMFEFISQGYDNQIKVIENATKGKLDAVDKESLSDRDRAAKKKKVEEQSAKDVARIKLKQWKAEKKATLAQIIIQGAMSIAKAYGQLGPVGGTVGAVIAGAAVAAQFAVAAAQKPPAFAEGGIVSGNTLAQVGEYAGVKSNPEVIAPLDKLKGMLGMNGDGQRIYGEFRVRGADLVAVVDTQRERDKRY